LDYAPPLSVEVIPVTVYWKSGGVEHPELSREQVHHAVFDYCARLYSEQDYEGPINCCL
jgi:hypothetical protein